MYTPSGGRVGVEVLGDAQLHQLALVGHLDRLDEGFDLVLRHGHPDEDAGQGQNDQTQALHELVFAPGPLLGLAIAALNFPHSTQFSGGALNPLRLP